MREGIANAMRASRRLGNSSNKDLM